MLVLTLCNKRPRPPKRTLKEESSLASVALAVLDLRQEVVVEVGPIDEAVVLAEVHEGEYTEWTLCGTAKDQVAV